ITDTISIDLGGKNKSGILLEPPNLLEYDKLYQINNQFDYQELLQELDSVGILKPNPPSIDFEQKTLLCYYQISGNHNSTSRLFKNNSTKEYLLLINIHLFDHFLAPHIVREWLLVPKIEANYNILIDTLMQY
ncbi:MAG TPA: hypothetical protein P5216_05000, partial [Bacteroidota bacterium]|nr:hypothetical protein [Bacteroidota bacterium]